MFEQGNNTVGNDIEVGIGINATRNGQAHQFQFRFVVFTSHFIATSGNNTAFHTAYARLNVELRSQGLCREFFLRNVREECTGIEEYGVTTDGFNDRHTGFFQFLCQVVALGDTVLDIVEIHRFGNTASHGFHIASGQAAV